MTQLNKLIEANSAAHFKLLTIVGENPVKEEEIIEELTAGGWEAYDIEEIVLDLVEELPEEKIKLRIADALKKWVKNLDSEKLILMNNEILFTSEMNKTDPFHAFKYHMRGPREAVLLLHAKLRGHEAIYSQPGKSDHKVIELNDVIFKHIDDVEIGGDN